MPMGFTWALWWCQAIHERAVEAAGLSSACRLQDGRVSFGRAEDSAQHLQYVDNVVVVGSNRAAVERDLDLVVCELRRRGLPLHKEEVTEGRSKVLGWLLGGSPPAVPPTP